MVHDFVSGTAITMKTTELVIPFMFISYPSIKSATNVQ